MKTRKKTIDNQEQRVTTSESASSVIPEREKLNLCSRITYLVDKVIENKKGLRFGRGYFYNEPNPIWGRFRALCKAKEFLENPDSRIKGKFSVRVSLFDEEKWEKHIIYDSSCNNTQEICQNLDFEFHFIRSLGYRVNDWEIVRAPDGKAFQAIRSEYKLEEYVENQRLMNQENEGSVLGSSQA